LFVALALVAGLSCAFKLPEGEGIYPLTRANLTMASTGEWLLILYAQWCPHCHRLLEDLPSFVKEIKAAGSSLKIGMIDADAEPAVQMQFTMHGFPSLYLAREGVVYEVPDKIGRRADAIIRWAVKDYVKETPVTGIKAPFGIPMRAFGAYSAFAISTFRFLEVYAKQLGIPPMWFFCGVAVTVAILVIVLMIVASRCRRPVKKPASQRKGKNKDDSAIAAPIVQRARAENPIEGAAIAETEKVQEKVKEAKEEQKLRRRAANKDEEGAREQQKRAQKKQVKAPKSRSQQNRPTQQPSKRA